MKLKKILLAGVVVPMMLALGGLAMAPAHSPTAQLQADEWQFHLSNLGSYCEACCWTGYCCDIPALCDEGSIDP